MLCVSLLASTQGNLWTGHEHVTSFCNVCHSNYTVVNIYMHCYMLRIYIYIYISRITEVCFVVMYLVCNLMVITPLCSPYYRPIPNVPDPPCSAYMQEMHVSGLCLWCHSYFCCHGYYRNLPQGWPLNIWLSISVRLLWWISEWSVFV